MWFGCFFHPLRKAVFAAARPLILPSSVKICSVKSNVTEDISRKFLFCAFHAFLFYAVNASAKKELYNFSAKHFATKFIEFKLL